MRTWNPRPLSRNSIQYEVNDAPGAAHCAASLVFAAGSEKRRGRAGNRTIDPRRSCTVTSASADPRAPRAADGNWAHLLPAGSEPVPTLSASRGLVRFGVSDVAAACQPVGIA
jgi:hypothetical protein